MALGTHEGQKTHGTFNEHFSYLHDVLTQAVQEGAATPEEYRGTLLQLLKAVEALRIKNEAAMLELERQKAYHQAAVNVCSMMSSLVLNIVDARTRERLRIREGHKLIRRREIEENKEKIAALMAAGQCIDAQELAKTTAKWEADLAAEDAVSLGSAAEIAITKQAITETQAILGGILGKPRPNPRTHEMNAIQEVVAESLHEVPVNEIAAIKAAAK